MAIWTVLHTYLKNETTFLKNFDSLQKAYDYVLKSAIEDGEGEYDSVTLDREPVTDRKVGYYIPVYDGEEDEYCHYTIIENEVE